MRLMLHKCWSFLPCTTEALSRDARTDITTGGGKHFLMQRTVPGCLCTEACLTFRHPYNIEKLCKEWVITSNAGPATRKHVMHYEQLNELRLTGRHAGQQQKCITMIHGCLTWSILGTQKHKKEGDSGQLGCIC